MTCLSEKPAKARTGMLALVRGSNHYWIPCIVSEVDGEGIATAFRRGNRSVEKYPHAGWWVDSKKRVSDPDLLLRRLKAKYHSEQEAVEAIVRAVGKPKA